MYRHSRLFSVISYITWIGWVIALALRDKGDPLVHRHINQSLLLHSIAVIGRFLTRAHGPIGILGDIVGIVCLILGIMGILRALRMSEEPLPLVGKTDWVE